MQNREVRRWDRCRACDSTKITELFSLGNHYVSDFVSQESILTGLRVPIELIYCNQCGLGQQRYTAPQELLYTGFYWYQSGVTESMRNALRDITYRIENLIRLHPRDIVLDIGSNDGTLLRSYSPVGDGYGNGLIKVGVEPASNMKEQGSFGIDYFINKFWTKENYFEEMGVFKAKVITAIGMLYDLEDPNQFIADIASVLAPDGIFVAQLMLAEDMFHTLDIGNLAHEHIEFYSRRSLEYLLNQNGLETFYWETNDTNNRSTRLYIRHSSNRDNHKQVPWVDSMDFLRFYNSMEQNRHEVDHIIDNRGNKVIAGYGASTKGNTLLQYYNIDHEIFPFIAERSPSKYGKYTVGTGIPIISEEEARKLNPDYFFVLPYTFFSEMVQREDQWLTDGGTFIIPLPKARTYSKIVKA